MLINRPIVIEGSKLFLLLLDGFRWDYFDLEGLELKGFPRLFREGVKAEYMIPSYPTNSYPNYYTLMTGRLIFRLSYKALDKRGYLVIIRDNFN